MLEILTDLEKMTAKRDAPVRASDMTSSSEISSASSLLLLSFAESLSLSLAAEAKHVAALGDPAASVAVHGAA